MGERALLEETELDSGHVVRVGDPVRVIPSRPGRHDGFIAAIRRIVSTPSGLIEVEVVGAPVARPAAFRTFTVDRLRRVITTKASR